jgi:osmotically-inducible protein OsmY
MKSDSQIQKDVEQVLEWDPSITHEHIGVSVSNGIVTLSGSTPSYFEKTEAEKVTQRVGGVKAVVENIEVQLPGSLEKKDQDIASTIVSQLKWNYRVPADSVKVTVENGWVTLRGEVEWAYQRTAAENSVRNLLGVKGIENNIAIKQKSIKPETIKQRIENSLKAEAKRDAGGISVEVQGSKVILSGKVHSFAEKDDAKWAAWSAPGVMTVENNLEISDSI